MRSLTYLVVLVLLGGTLPGCGNKLAKQLAAEPLYEADFTGFYLVDAVSGEVLAERNARKLFTPASTTKILTLATGLAWLDDGELPALAYGYEADTLRLWGLAYPLLGADEESYNEKIREAIGEWAGTVEVNLHGYAALPRYGAGWMWDDYPYNFQTERSGLPVYRNTLAVWQRGGILATRPAFFALRNSGYGRSGTLIRGEDDNRYSVNLPQSNRDTLRAPLYRAAGLMPQLLEDWTGHPVRYHNKPLPADWGLNVWRGAQRDSVLQTMMWESDNFLAEQLLLEAGLVRHDLTKPTEIMERARDSVLRLQPTELAWADASGISHYNLISPRALARVLQRLYAEHPSVLNLFPAGGESGTLENWYGGPGEQPYVFAKTGSLRHNFSLAGYLRAESGRLLTFAIMHNHYRGSSLDYRRATGRTLDYIREHY